MKTIPILILLSIPTLFIGCVNLIEPSKGRVKLDENQIKVLEGLNSHFESLELSVTKNEAESIKRLQKLKEEAIKREAELKQAIEDINAVGQNFKEITNGLATIADPSGGMFTGALKLFIDTQATKKAIEEIEDSAKIVKIEAELSAATNFLEKEIGDLREAFKNSSAFDKGKFKEEVLLLAKAQGFSEDQLKELKESTSNQLLGLAGGGGTVGLLTLAALARTYGRSRGQPEIEKIKQDVALIKEKAKNNRPSPPPENKG